MNVELSHLRYFVAVAEELHFGRAAERLHIAQPPLTRRIHLLEQQLECRLLERNTRGTRLTPAGEHLLERARAILAETGDVLETVQRIGNGIEGQLTVATAPSLMLGPLPAMIRTFRRRYPKVKFRLTESGSSEIVKAVLQGSADLGLIRGGEGAEGLRTHAKWKEPMSAIVPGAHPLAGRRTRGAIAVRELASEPFVLFHRHIGPSFHDEVTGHCRKAGGFTPNVVQEARQWSSIIALVSAGIGVSIGPAPLAELMPKSGAVFVPVQGFKTTVRWVGRLRDSNPAIEKFLGCSAPAAVE